MSIYLDFWLFKQEANSSLEHGRNVNPRANVVQTVKEIKLKKPIES
jgi:hypothetical protein